MEIRQPSNLNRFFSSIPFIGPAMGFVIENTEMGIAQYGIVFGLIRGAAVGLAMAVTLIVIGEGVTVGFRLGRVWLDQNWVNQKEASIKIAVIEKQEKKNREIYVHKHPNAFVEPSVKVAVAKEQKPSWTALKDTTVVKVKERQAADLDNPQVIAELEVAAGLLVRFANDPSMPKIPAGTAYQPISEVYINGIDGKRYLVVRRLDNHDAFLMLATQVAEEGGQR
jgi:hypothetical protein